ncbi:hypothetical protein C8R45DRAFT_1214243 [Mycena sanguinolenta]|nr:hypothetical protein C8R45DRAFT_1214243 [Mycena sanguinolenta]
MRQHLFKARVYRFPSEQTPMEDAEAVAILGADGMAATSTDAVTLVFVDELSEEEELSLPKLEEETALGTGIQDLYYRLHTRSGEDHSMRAFDPEEPALGRIDLSVIAPPRDAQAIQRCIAKAEGKPIYAFADLYADVSEGPLANHTSFFAGDGPQFRGSNAADALRIVQPERRPGLYNRPLKVLQPQPKPVQFHFTLSPPPLPWLEVFPGDIVHTDGIMHMEKPDLGTPYMNSYSLQAAYTVVKANGVKGLIKPENVIFLDE